MISATGSIVFGIMIGRLLGPEALGAFTFAISVVLVCVLVAKFGCDKVVTKQTAIEPERNYKTQLYAKISRYLWRSFLFFLIPMGLVFLASHLPVAGIPANEKIDTLQILVYATPFAALAWIISGYFKGIRLPQVGLLLETGSYYAVSSILIAAFYLLYGEISLELVSASFVAGSFIVFSIGYCIMPRSIGRIANAAWSHSKPHDRNTGPRLTKPGSTLHFLFIDATNFIMQSGSFLIAGFLLRDETLGLLRASERGAVSIAIIWSITNVIVMPRIVRSFNDGKFNSVADHGRWAVKVNLLLSAPIAILFTAAPAATLSIFGSGFAEGAVFLQIMVGAQIINVLAGPIAVLLSMTNQERVVFLINSVGIVASVILYPVLILTFDGLGFALAYLALMAFRNIACLIAAWRSLGICYLLPRRFVGQGRPG